MDVKEAITSRRTVRAFKDTPVPDDVLVDILETAHWSPSPVNSQPWRFIVIKNKDTLKELMEQAKYGKHLADAPCAVAVVATPLESHHWYNEIEENKYAGAIVASNMMLAAWEKGIGTGWVSLERSKANDILGLPENHTVVALLTMGYPEHIEPHAGKERKPVYSLIFAEKFGERFPRIDI
ncbi:MAG: nitroreductase family protein [Candidatus Methanofastidiosia archaeon]|jgi:nitroreductase